MSAQPAVLRSVRVVFDVSDAMYSIADLKPSKGWIDVLMEDIKDLGLFEEVSLDGHINHAALVMPEYDAGHVQECQDALNGVLQMFYTKQLKKRKP